MLEILDSIIATVAVVLVLSLIVQAIQQIIKQVWSFKARYMERELLAMFQQTALPFIRTTLTEKLLGFSPVSLQVSDVRKSNKPVVDLITILKTKLASIGYNDLSLLETMTKEDFDKLLVSISKELDDQPAATPDENSQALTQRINDLKTAIVKARDDVENWYDLTLKAFQDHYERRMKMWSYALSLIVVVALNASLFDIYKEFSSDRALRESAIALGTKLTSMPRDSVIIKEAQGKADTAVVQRSAEEIKKEIKKNLDDVKAMLDNGSFQVMRWGRPSTFTWPVQVLGWLSMALLVGLGAPFWYDFFKTIMGIKNSFKNQTGAAEGKD